MDTFVAKWLLKTSICVSIGAAVAGCSPKASFTANPSGNNLELTANPGANLGPLSLSYSGLLPSYWSGASIAPLTAQVSGNATATGNYTFSVSSGQLPNGLSLDPSSGEITGTLLENTLLVSPVTISVARGSQTGSTSLTITQQIFPFSYAQDPVTGVNGLAFSDTVAPIPGVTSSYQVTSGTLPAGLTLDAGSGTISGTPTELLTSHPITIQRTSPGGVLSAIVQLTIIDQAPTQLAYQSPVTYTKGVAISPNKPANQGGAIVSYAITGGSLPPGLALQTNGSITGTPTQIQAQSSVVITGTNSGGATSATVLITVNDQLPTDLTYTTPAVYTVHQPITNNVPHNSGGTILSYSLTQGTLPPGLSLNSTTGVISGTPTALQTTASTVTVTGTNSGGSAAATISIKVNDQAPTNLTYSTPVTYTKGVTITPNSPHNTGGAVVSYAVTGGSLPAGLAINSTTGVISGTPTALQTTASSVTVTATNSGGTSTASISVTVNDQAPANLVYTSPVTYTLGTAISPNSPHNTGGAIVSYAVTSGSLPAGLTLNSTTGVISGTPSALQTTAASVTITATNSGGNTTGTVSVAVDAQAPASLAYASPVTYTKGVAISPNSPTSSGGTISGYAVTGGTLPAGLTLNSTTGTISGTPSALQTSPVTVTITGTNSGGNVPTNVVITVDDQAPTQLAYASPITYTKGVAISPNTPTSSGGPIVSYTVTTGTLPAGLSINSTTGVISGTPSALQTSAGSITITGTNSGGSTTASISITVNDQAPTQLGYTSPVTYTKGVAISPNSPKSSGGAVVSYAVTSGSLPAGLALNSATGVISGTPTALQTTAGSITITATNSGGSTTGSLSIAVNDQAPTKLAYASPVTYTKGIAISPNSPTSSGGAVVSYAVTSGSLPAGLALNSTTGVISGTPTALQTTAGSISITATNSGGSTTGSLSITVNDQAPTQLAYASPVTYYQGVAISPNSPKNAGGAIVSYAVTSGSLPAGLALNSTTGVISGTPTALQTTAASVTITGTNSGGNTTASISITVSNPAPTKLAYTTPVTYVRNTPVTNTPVMGGGTITSFTLTQGTLPAGLALQTNGTISGTPTTIAPATTVQITGANSGGSVLASVTITIADEAPSALTYETPVIYTQGKSIPPNTPSNSGGAITGYAVTSGTLPAGLALNATSGVLSGTPTLVAPAASVSITGSNATGSSTAVVSITVQEGTTTGGSSSSSSGGGSTTTIRGIQPALAVRGMSCLACHATIQANVITDFGYSTRTSDNWFLNESNGTVPSPDFGETHYDPYTWQVLNQVSGQVTVPKTTVPASIVSQTIAGGSSSSGGGMDLAAFLESPNANVQSSYWLTYYGQYTDNNVPSKLSFTASVQPGTSASGAALPAVAEAGLIYIGAPTSSEILALAPGQPTTGPWVNNIVDGAAKGSVTGLSVVNGLNNKGYVTNLSNVQCAGMDVVINGTLLLDNLNVNADDGGCRLYVTGSVFVQGPISYVNSAGAPSTDATANLQITSSTSIIMGIGLSGTILNGDGTPDDGGTAPLSVRLTSDARNPVFRSAPDGDAYGTWANGVMAEAANIGGTLLVDASDVSHAANTGKSAAGQTRTAINYNHLLLNAPDIQSRYLGQMNGVIVSEIAVFSLGEFFHSFDPVFANPNVPILPILPYDIVCMGSAGSSCNPAQ